MTTGEPDTSRLRAPAREVLRAEVTDEPLDMNEHMDQVAASGAGAVVTFAGVVRDHDRGCAVHSIEYVAHPTAGQVIAQVAAAVAARFDVDRVAVSHRVGVLAIGECALAVAVSAAHSREAFDAATALVKDVKRDLPVWKRQVFTDGTEEWVACP